MWNVVVASVVAFSEVHETTEYTVCHCMILKCAHVYCPFYDVNVSFSLWCKLSDSLCDITSQRHGLEGGLTNV